MEVLETPSPIGIPSLVSDIRCLDCRMELRSYNWSLAFSGHLYTCTLKDQLKFTVKFGLIANSSVCPTSLSLIRSLALSRSFCMPLGSEVSFLSGGPAAAPP